MQFDLRNELEKAGNRNAGLLLLSYRAGAIFFGVLYPALLFIYPPEYKHDVTSFYWGWAVSTAVLALLLFLIRFNIGGMPAQGCVFSVENGILIVGYYKPGGKHKKDRTFPLRELEFVDGGETGVSSSNMASGVRVSASAKATRMALKTSGKKDLITTFQFASSNQSIVEEFKGIAQKINIEIAKARGATPEEIEAARKAYITEGKKWLKNLIR